MPSQDPLSYLQALLARDFECHRQHPHLQEIRAPLVITISRDYGAQGETIARRLSECLGIPVYDREILDRVAQRAKADKFHFQAHDEQVSAGFSTFLYSLVSGTSATLADYRRHLYEVVTDIARQDCILIGRGAHLILTGKKIFRVRVVASKLVCASRIAEEFNIPLLEAEQKVYEVNNKRHKSILELYGASFEHCSLEHAKNFDLVINTDNIPAESAMAVILFAMREACFELGAPRCTL
ncbi:MAG: cytidylate kinase-like family protein [Methylococcaceae bacterium]|nr:cytidylate kinase-like family protein [Methylococcaceae bacterium]